MALDELRYEYVGFWSRVLASLIDTVLALFIVWPILHFVYGPLDLNALLSATDPQDVLGSVPLVRGPVDFLVSWVLPPVAIVAFWIARQATPGKMAIRARIVDADTGATPTARQLIGRYLAYYVSMFGLGLGFLWVGWDKRKQGWHDKLAGTVVVRQRRGSTSADK